MSARRQDVLERFLATVDTLATDPAQLLEAVAFGLDRVLDELLRSACREADVDVEEFSAWISRDQAVRSELQERVGRIFQPEAVDRARARAHIREIERHLQVLRFTLSGEQPDGWVWQTLDGEERERLRAAYVSGDHEDPPLLARVTEALARLRRNPDAFGRCGVCREVIPGDRLRLIPWAERCTPCQLAREDGSSRGVVDRRVEVMKFFEEGLPVPREDRPHGDEV